MSIRMAAAGAFDGHAYAVQASLLSTAKPGRITRARTLWEVPGYALKSVRV
jgi:hypothetical protein